MFSFPQFDPETTDRVTAMPVPLDRYLGAAFDQGQHDSMFNSIMRMREISLDNADPTSPMLTPQQANQKYAIGDLKFDQPIRETVASTMNERKKAEMDRQFILSEGASAARFAPGMAAQILGGFTNPLDIGSMFIPIVGEEAAAEKVAAAGGGRIAQALARGLVTREALDQVPKVMIAAGHGMVQQGLYEIPNLMASSQDRADYGIEQGFANVVGGGLFAGLIHSAGRALAMLDRGTKIAMAGDAVNSFLRDESPKVQDYVQVDENAIRARVEAQNGITASPDILQEILTKRARQAVSIQRIFPNLNLSDAEAGQLLDQANRLREMYPQIETQLRANREASIQDFMDKKSQEYATNKQVSDEVQQEITQQQQAGKILTQDVIDKYLHKDTFDESEISNVEKDAQTLEKNFTSGLSDEDREAAQKELDETLGQIDEPQETAIKAALDCLTEKVV